MKGLLVLLVIFFGARAQNDCGNLAALEKELEKQELIEALEEVDEITDKMRHYRSPCGKKCLDLDDFKECNEAPKEFDYVIVGGGRTACVMANRLSEVNTINVAVLEMGDDVTPISKIPALSSYTKFSKFVKTKCLEPQDDFGLAMSYLPVFEGMAFGGTGNINTNVHNNGHPSDFQSQGCYDDILKYFQKSEKANLTGEIQAAYHNFDGPLSQTHNPPSELGQAFINCGLEQGYKEIDPAGNFEEGVSKIKSNSEKGRRVNHAEAFLKKVSWRKNLVTIANANVFKILFDGNRAVGVRYVKDGKIYTMKAKKEVVVAIGAIDTAKLLMASGVGPKEQLEKHRIPLVKNLPVGRNLFYKLTYIGLAFEVNSTHTPKCIEDIINKDTITKYMEAGEGPLAQPFSFEALTNIKINSPSPNVQYRIRNAFWTTDRGNVDIKTIGMSPGFYKRHFKCLEGRRVFTIYVIVKALSSGKVKLRSKNPFEDPEICGNFFSNAADKKNMIDAIKFIVNFMKCESFKKLGIKFYDDPVPGCEHKKGDKYWECAIKYLTVPYRDFSGTCKMGPRDDPTAVVDSTGLVLGVDALRIIGRDVMDAPTMGGAGAFSTMLAEKTGDHIKEREGIVRQSFCAAPPLAAVRGR